MVRARRRGLSLTECVLAISLALVLLPALFPPGHHELGYLRQRLEVESARLLVEGELSRARQEAAAGRLAAGERALELGERYRSRANLPALELRERVRPGPDGLWEVEVTCSWLPSPPARELGPPARRRVALTTWVSRGTPR